MALLLSFRKLAMVLKSGAKRPISHIGSTLRWASRSKRRHRLDAVEIAIDVDLQHDRGVVSGPASIGWNGTFKTQIDQIKFVDKDVDYAHRIGIADVVVEALWK